MLFIGLDDTDILESRGTGHLARHIAAVLDAELAGSMGLVRGVTRHQLLVDPRVPCTKNNSCAALLLEAAGPVCPGGQSGEHGPGDGDLDPIVVLERVRALMLEDFQPGSDPGLCVARGVPVAITEFGRRAQQQLVTQAEARALAAAHQIPMLGLGGTEDGVIGALAAVGLAAGGEDGRYVLVDRSRELTGLQPVSALLEAGIAAVQTVDGLPVVEGLIQTDKLRPARRGGQPIAVVEWAGDYWLPLKLD